MLCERIKDSDEALAKTALETVKEIVRSSTTSMTSIPKPFKFIKPHYDSIVTHYERLPPSFLKRILADFLSVLAMTMAEPGKNISLAFLKQGTMQEYKNWGHGYLQHLASEIGKEYNTRLEIEEGTDDLIELVSQIVPYFIENNAEADAIDLSMEVDQLEALTQYVQKSNFLRIIEYLQKCALYCADQEEMEKTLQTAYDISLKSEVYTCALRIALKLDKDELVRRVFAECQDYTVKKQLCFQIARQRIIMPDLDSELNKIASNSMLTEYFLKFAKELDILEPKTPDQVYKTHLEEKAISANIDSSKANLAHTYVNAFVNCASKKDTLLLKENNTDPWIYKVKGDGQVAAVASIGMIDLWDPDQGATDISEYLDTKDGFTKMGACIGVGLYCSGTTNEVDPAKALLNDYLQGKEQHAQLGSIIGLGISYAGSAREDFLDDLVTLVVDTGINSEISAYAALSLGLIFVGKCQEEVSNAIIQTLSERNEAQLNATVSRFFAVALGLLFLGQQEVCEATLEILGMIEHPIGIYCQICIEGCAYVGSGNVLKVQKMLHQCVEHLEEAKSMHQQVAVISIALIASSEEIGNEMAMRSLNHILQYCDVHVKRAVPLAIAILNLSNPKLPVMDLLLKLSHDEDTELSQRAMLAMGLIGAGSNNSRLSDILRNVASYYTKESNGLFLVRLAQGLIHMGKGMLTIQPYYSDKYLLNKVGMAGIITVIHSALDMKNIILDKYHYNLFYLALSIYPKMLFTLDENLENQVVNLRVGTAVDVVGQAGKPKRITGFQTHTSPVLINYGERAEFAIEEYMTVQESILENFVIIKKNPEYIPEEDKPKKKNSM